MSQLLLTLDDYHLLTDAATGSLRNGDMVPDDSPPEDIVDVMARLNQLIEEVLQFRWVYLRELRASLKTTGLSSHYELMHYDFNLFVAGTVFNVICKHPALHRKNIVLMQFINTHGDVLIDFE